MSKITEYLKETKTELSHVSWPTRRQAAIFTVVVVAVSVITAFYLSVFDFIFHAILKSVI
jgi:preprotein translocase subunit SecE